MMGKGGVFAQLIEQFMVLPGIGRKTAQRLAFFVLKMDAGGAKKIGEAIIAVKEKLSFCSICSNIAEEELCSICASPSRDRGKILVVEEPSTLFSIEKTGEYKGLYQVLLGIRSPLSGYEATDQTIHTFLKRLVEGVQEVIIATNPNMDGEATAIYLTRLIRPIGIKVTRIAFGVPVGGDLEYADELTLAKSLEGRREIT